MKLEKEIGIIPVVTYDKNSKNTYKTVTFMINIPELTKKEMKIIRKGQVSKLKLTLEAEEPILDEAERKYLSCVIRPFRDRVKCIIKKKSYDYDNREYIVIHAGTHETTPFPYFKKGTMYKGMELNKEYTLEELGL